MWSDETLGLKRVKSNGTISFLTDLAFRGLGRYMVYPWYQVSMYVTQKLRYSSQGLSTYMYHPSPNPVPSIVRFMFGAVIVTACLNCCKVARDPAGERRRDTVGSKAVCRVKRGCCYFMHMVQSVTCCLVLEIQAIALMLHDIV